MVDFRLFNHTALCGEANIFLFRIERYNRFNLFVLGNLNDIYNRPAARRPCRFGNLIPFNRVYPAAVGKEQYVVVRGADKHIFHKVLVLGLMGGYTHTAAVLSPVLAYGQALYVSRMGK